MCCHTFLVATDDGVYNIFAQQFIVGVQVNHQLRGSLTFAEGHLVVSLLEDRNRAGFHHLDMHLKHKHTSGSYMEYKQSSEGIIIMDTESRQVKGFCNT